MDGSLGRCVDRHAATRFPPGIGSEIDDRALARGNHARRDSLGCEEHVPYICCDALVVIIRRHLVPGVAVVSGSVVDEDCRRAERGIQCCEGFFKSIDIAKIAGLKVDVDTLAGNLLRQGITPLNVQVNKPDA